MPAPTNRPSGTLVCGHHHLLLSWSSQCGLGLGHPGTRRHGCQEPSGAGGGPAASPGGRRKCYFCLLLSSGKGCPGRGGQRRPLRLGPAHREFLKDAHGCREDGRRGRGGWARPPGPPPGRGGQPSGRGGGGRSGRPFSGWPKEASESRAWPRLPGWQPSVAGPGHAAWRHVAGSLPGRAAPKSRRPGFALGIEATLFSRWALQRGQPWPAPGPCSPTAAWAWAHRVSPF